MVGSLMAEMMRQAGLAHACDFDDPFRFQTATVLKMISNFILDQAVDVKQMRVRALYQWREAQQAAAAIGEPFDHPPPSPSTFLKYTDQLQKNRKVEPISRGLRGVAAANWRPPPKGHLPPFDPSTIAAVHPGKRADLTRQIDTLMKVLQFGELSIPFLDDGYEVESYAGCNEVTTAGLLCIFVGAAELFDYMHYAALMRWSRTRKDKRNATPRPKKPVMHPWLPALRACAQRSFTIFEEFIDAEQVF